MSFDDDDLDGIAKRANDTIFGLAGASGPHDVSVAHKMVRKIRAGRREGLSLNAEVKSIIKALQAPQPAQRLPTFDRCRSVFECTVHSTHASSSSELSF